MGISPRKTPKKSSTKSPKVGNETIEHYNAILLEDIQSKMELVIEGMQATEGRLSTRMQEMEVRLSGDINMLKAAVTTHSGEIRGLKTEVQRLDAKIDGVEANLSGKIDKVETRLSDRINQVEVNLSDKIDKQDTRWTGHENRIVTLEKAANS